MRLISQDGKIDVPYDKVILGICDQNNGQEYVIYAYHDSPRPLFIATYSTEAKAIKVMEMLREQYEYGKKISVPQLEESGIAEDDDVMLFNTRLINDYFKGGTYLPVKLFKFPDDSEVEV